MLVLFEGTSNVFRAGDNHQSRARNTVAINHSYSILTFVDIIAHP
jgi:hypothetical protein